jgi:1-phosphatidylinositol-3-phosphate 5-kinase
MDLIRCKSNIIRNFAYKGYTFSFSNAPVQDVYEIQIPRLQITKGSAIESQSEGSTVRDAWQEADKDKLRLEITHWWKGVKEHMGQLEEFLEGGSFDVPLRKPLPPSPPPESESEEDATTPKPVAKPLPPINESEIKQPIQPSATPSSFSTTSSTTEEMSSVARLANLRKTFNVTEQALYASLANTPGSLTNDVRRSFYSSAKAAANRLTAWEMKHAPGFSKHDPYPEPGWWAPGWHALPGGSVVIRDGEWASIIAFTLSSSDYERELYDMSYPRATSSVNADAGSNSSSVITSTTVTSMSSESTVTNATSIESSVPPSLTAFVTSMQALTGTRSRAGTLDPDDESQASNWYQPESSTSQISRKEHPKEGSNILSLRDVLRNKTHTDNSAANSTTGSQISSNVGSSVHGPPSLGIVTKDVQASMQPLSPDAVDVFEKILQDAEKDDYTLVDSLSSSPNDTIKVSTSTAASNKTTLPTMNGLRPSMFAPPVPEKDFPTPLTSANATPMTEKSFSEANISFFGSSSSHISNSDEPAMSAVGSLTSTIANAMRYVLSAGQPGSPEHPLPPPPFHNLLAMDSPKIDSKPHIRYDCVIGKRLKFSCTIYYAKQFDSLRRRCGIHEIMIESLKRTENWAAEGWYFIAHLSTNSDLYTQAGRANPTSGRLWMTDLS